MPRVDYYFDVISPYSYVGFEALEQLKDQWKGVEIRYIPFSLHTVMRECGNRPPAMLPNRSVMMLRDLDRTARYWNIPLTPPPLFMEWIRKYKTTDAMHLLLVLEDRDPALMVRAAREMWHRLWWRSERIFEADDFREILRAIGVPDVDDVLRKSGELKYGEKLAEHTNKCVEMGAYGAPWINVLLEDGSEHQFFGSDRFHLIAELIGKPHPVPKAKM